MKKQVIASLFIGGLIACNTENAVIEELQTTKDEPTVEKDTSSNGTVLKSSEIDLAAFKFEDYGKLKTRAKLIEVIGEDHVINGESWYAEGTVRYLNSMVTNPKNGHVIKVLWNQKDSNRIDFIEASYHIYDKDFIELGVQKIPSSSGLYTGMSINEVLQFNEGKHIHFAGFGWDYAGNHFAKEGSKLSNTGLRLIMGYTEYDKIPRKFFGDIELSTENDSILNSPIIIETMKLYPNGELN